MRDPDQATAVVRPVCFMVMPFNVKPVENGRQSSPQEVNFDELWARALMPAIEGLGYTAVRADADAGSLIVKDMFQRLAYADLLIADVTIPNGNVYYEVGIRHVAKRSGCILVAADWSRQLFDIDQFRSVRYPLANSEPSDDEAATIAALFAEAIPQLRNGITPYHEFIENDGTSTRDQGVFRERADRLAEFQEKVAAARLATGDTRADKVRALLLEYRDSLESLSVSLELLTLVRDVLGWDALIEFIESLPADMRSWALVSEQRLLAVANTGNHEEAIAGLERLIRDHGASPERHGLAGGRYKRLWRAAKQEGGVYERRYLKRAIDHYGAGMALDLNQYYCSSNLPQLLRARGANGDEALAIRIDHLVIEACERAAERGSADEWLRPTLLGAAFRSGDIDKAEELVERIEEDGVDAWKLASTMDDLTDIVEATADGNVRRTLAEILVRLRALL